jgi:hypothetical protein
MFLKAENLFFWVGRDRLAKTMRIKIIREEEAEEKGKEKLFSHRF